MLYWWCWFIQIVVLLCRASAVNAVVLFILCNNWAVSGSVCCDMVWRCARSVKGISLIVLCCLWFLIEVVTVDVTL
jgi:hypothetical protein